MKTFTRVVSFTFLLALAAWLVPSSVQAQSILNPTDTVITYNSANPPTQPAFGTIGKWVRTKRVSWNTNNYKCYVYDGYPFRLRFPKSYNPTANDGKKYPILVFFHGDGEGGPVTDNEYSLFHGGQVWDAAVSNGTFDGYVFVLQTPNGFWGQPVYNYISQILDYMVVNNKLDPFRITTNGLSAGGAGVWDYSIAFPQYVAGAVPMSAACLCYNNTAPPAMKFTPTWLIQGGLDGSPDPSTTAQLVAAMNNAGADLNYQIFPNDGHDTWDDTWAQKGWWPFLNNDYASNPWALFGRTQFCQGDAVNITVGVAPGYQAYRWRMNGTALPTTTNSIHVTAYGTYDCQVERGGVWSDWSHVPCVVGLMPPTVSPNITIAPLTSNVIPALDTSKGVTLQVPTGFASYLWQAVGGSTTLSTTNTLYTTTPGQYHMEVTQQFGCSSTFSNPYTVIPANGPNPPSPAAGLIITALSQTQLRLDWNVDPGQPFPQTGFEVYQASSAAGPYQIIGILGAGATTTTATGLKPGTTYYYKVRSVNNTAAAAASNVANGTTTADTQPPTAPTNLVITATTHSSVSLSWGVSTDNVGVTKYDIYVNGKKVTYDTTGTSMTVYNLNYPNSYNFVVTARDFAGNVSPFSNQVTAEPLGSGLVYQYYNLAVAPTVMPNYHDTLNETKSGISTSGPSLSPRTQTTNYGFLWQGYIHITVAGNYSFRTVSSDGSQVFLGPLNGDASPYSFTATPIVNNNGLHNSAATVTSTPQALQIGTYPIAITYFHGSRSSTSSTLTLSWTTPSSGTFTTIPSAQFADVTVTNGAVPNAPSNLLATALAYNKVGLTWTDNSSNETGFEIWRSTTNGTTGFTTIGLAQPGATSYTDNTVSASTKYFYQIRAIGQFGQSNFVSNYAEAYWPFNTNANDSTGNNHTLTLNSGPTYDLANHQEGNASILLNGTTQSITPSNTGSFLQTSMTQRTVAFWFKSAANTGNRVIFDIGGSDNGLSLLLGSNTLVAGVASGNTRSTITAPFTALNTWTHVALVYNGDSLLLYVNGALAASTTALTFHSISTTTNASKIGQINGTIASNTSGTGLFSGNIDAFGVYNTAFGPDVIANLMNGTFAQSIATTQSLPTAPAAPTGLVSEGTSTASSVTVNWVDNANNEDNYQLYRSVTTNANYLLIATLPANTVSYKDTGLFANGVYYYKVRAANIGGTSAYSNEDSAHTSNHVPTITAIANQFMRYGTQLVLNVVASDVDPGTLTLQVTNLPAFGTFTPTGNGKGTITFNPQQSDVNTYNNITVTVTDASNSSASTSFNLNVNSNFNPVITRPVNNVTLNEKATAQINLSATDQNAGDVLTFSFIGLPGFATTVLNPGSAQINLAPGYADGGSYTVQARVDDGNNGFDTVSFTITVMPVTPPTVKVYEHFADGSAGTVAGAPWNNTSALPTQNEAFANLLDQNGANSGITLTITSPWQNLSFGNGTNTFGQSTGNNSGVYPDAVLGSAYYTVETPQTIQVSGLDVTTKYNFTFFGSRGNVNDDRTTIYSITNTGGTSSVSLQTANNTSQTVAINNVVPNADGTVVIGLARGANAPYGYMNSVVIEKQFNDHTAPAKPRNIAGQFVNNSQVALTWVAAAYNANNYQVYRSANVAGPYTLLNPGATNPVQASYTDSTISQNNTYYYYVTATNAYGVSPTSDTVTMAIPNLPPVVATIAPVVMQAQTTKNVSVSATDPGDGITLSTSGMPGFASFTDNGNGQGTLSLAPATADVGSYTGNIVATDNHGGVSTTPVSITVGSANLRNIYINMNDGSASEPAQGAPWNNMNSAPNAGVGIANLKDDQAALTGFGITLVDPWTGANNVGPTTGNNSGVYPDNVMQSLYYDGSGSGSPRHVNITGLSSKGKYNVIFYGGRTGVSDNRITHYTVGSQSVQLNAASNTSQTVELDGLSPDASGKIQIQVAQDAGAPFAYLNALQIQYTFDTTFYPPTNLVATSPNSSTINLNWVSNAPGTTTSFEIWSATSPTGPWTLLNTVGGTTTSFSHTGLTAGSAFFYEVRGIAGARQSAFSNVASSSTVAYSVYVQMNDGAQNLPQGGIWNSINTLIFPGFVLPNMINGSMQPTGINLGMVTNFTGYNVFGVVTGNNSGLFPDNVMNGFFYMNFGDTAKLIVTGLDLTSTYNLNFFGSRANPATSVMSTYKVGNTVVSLNAANNSTQTVQVAGLKPDSTGSITFSVYNSDGGRAYLNALVIDGVPSAAETFGQTPVATALPRAGAGAAVTGAANALSLNGATAPYTGAVKLMAYPNPFIDEIRLSVSLDKPVDKLKAMVIDVTGRVLHEEQLTGLPQGVTEQKLHLNAAALPAGTYFVILTGLPDGKTKAVPMIKQNEQ